MGRKEKSISFEEFDIAVGGKLRRIRQEKGLSLTAMAKLLGYTKGYLSGIENGHVQPSQELLKCYEQKLGFEPEEFSKRLRTQFLNATGSKNSFRNVPYLRNPYFTGRREVLDRLRMTLVDSKQVPTVCVICGLGGIGKTQIAIEYLYSNRREYQSIFWLKFDSPDSLASNFASIATTLNLSEKSDLNREQIITEVKNWLKEHTNYLIVIDGLDNTEDLGTTYKFISQISGHVIITSRIQAPLQEVPCILVEKMTIEEGALFLLRRIEAVSYDSTLADVSATDFNKALEISRLLDGLPLALEQAGAFIKETECGLSGYLDLYQSHQMDILKQRSELVAGYKETVATTWSLSFQKVENDSSFAADLLRLCAFLDSVIPEEVITIGSAEISTTFASIAGDLFKINIALGELVKYSFLRRNLNDKTLTIHKLVQTVLQDAMDQEKKYLWITRAYKAVNSAFPFGKDFSERRARYCHVETFLRHSLSLQEQIEGPDSIDVAIRLTNLADLYRVQADFAQSESFFSKALSIQQRVFGLSHPNITTTLQKFARLYRAKSEYVKAESLYLEAIDIQEKTLGTEHPEVAKSLWSLAKLYHILGKYDIAEELCQRSLQIQEKCLETDDPDIAYTLNILAEVFRSKGRYRESGLLYQRTLDIWEKRFGPQDSHVALVLSKWAEVYIDQVNYVQAEFLLKRSLDIRERVLGNDHPYTAFSLDNLGTVYFAKGEYDLAESVYTRALTIREQKLGLDHTYTAITHFNLAKLYSDLGKYDLAELHYKQALEIREQKLGSDHPDVAVTLEDYAIFLRRINRVAEAQKLESRTKRIKTKQISREKIEHDGEV